MKEWEKQERKVAKRRGGVRNGGSGSGWRHRNDVREAGVLWEMKQTDGKSIRVEEAAWLNLRKNAITSGRMPAMHLQIRGTGLVVISEDDFDERFPPGE